MSGLLLWLEIVSAAVLVVVFAFLARRVYLARTVGSFDCSIRPAQGAGGWAIGVARYGSGRLDWFRVFSLSPRPSRVFHRDRLEIIGRRTPEGVNTLAGDLIVRCRYEVEDLDFAMSTNAYLGLSSWAEAAPPGQQFDFS